MYKKVLSYNELKTKAGKDDMDQIKRNLLDTSHSEVEINLWIELNGVYYISKSF